jgi:hypothetical protein
MLYDLIPNMPQARLSPLIERYSVMLAEIPVLDGTASPSVQVGGDLK